MKQIQFDKLKRLAAHLKSGKLGHKEFDFGTYNDFEEFFPEDMSKCGTSGCAIGECPIAFPKDWEFSRSGIPVLKSEPFGSANESGMKYFGLNMRQYDHLFMPTMQNPERFGGIELSETASKEQVADNILAFCEKMQNGIVPTAKTTEP